MKAILAVALLALSFTTGFTCSKNAPTEGEKTTQEAPANQEQMATPPAAQPEAQPAQGADASAPAAAPAEGAAPAEQAPAGK